MPIKKLVLLFVFGAITLACKENDVEYFEPQIIPAPNAIEKNDGVLVINKDTYFSFPWVFRQPALMLETFIDSAPYIKTGTGDNKTLISFNYIEDENSSKASYTLRIDTKGVHIEASDVRGAFYAAQTLKQLLPAEFVNKTYKKSEVVLPCLIIKDQPQFAYRGMHLDVGRHMYSVEFIKKYIDAMAMLKMNTFHWHLTEDQGWRIEIKKYPKLQEIAAYRDETLVGHYSDQPHQFDGKRYGGYYTQDEIRAIVKYAEERFITIIPEIEMPGHSQAAIAAYPELGCSGDQVEVAKTWGVFEDIYCPTEATFRFLEDVIDEVVALFPGKYIHIGGDEAPKTRWKNCKYCQDLIKEKGLKDENGLQSYFIQRMENYINSKGKQIIGWDEILEGGLAPNATVMSWRGTKGAIEAAEAGHEVIMTPTSHCYFDYYQSENEDEPLAIGGFLPLEKVYDFNPIPEGLSKEASNYVLGAQGNIWTEYMPTEAQVEYMAFPRMLAISEVLWSNPEQKDYTDFVSRLEKFHNRLDALDINYANHLYEVEGEMIIDDGVPKYKLSTPITEDKVIRLSLHAGEPYYEDRVYIEPIEITKSRTIKAAVFRYNSEEKLGKTFMQHIIFHKAIGAKITIDKTPHKAYSGSGAEGLINGIKGSDKRYGDREWLGFWGEDVLIEIDLRREKEINSIQMRFHNGNGQWIYAPKEVLIAFDNEQYDVFTIKGDELLIDFEANFSSKWRKKIYIKVLNYGEIPEGKQGAGHKAWTFIDEIIVN